MEPPWGPRLCRNVPQSAPHPTDDDTGSPDLSPRGLKAIAVETWKEAGNDNLSLISAGVAFYGFLALVPLLTAFVLSYGLVAEPQSVVRHMETLTALMPQNAAEIIGNQLRDMVETSRTETGFALLLAIVIAIYGASKGAGAVVTALNVTFEVGESRSFIGRTLVALTMTGGAVIVLFLAILAISALNFLRDLLPDLGGATYYLLQGAFFLGAGSAVVLLLAVIYRFGPNRPDAEWRWITPGSALATLVWLAATAGFGAYVSNFSDYNATYGSLGAIVVFLTWIYLSAYIVLLGAELNAVLEGRSARPLPTAAPEAQRDESGETAVAPSMGSVVARLGFFSGLLALLGTPRRERSEA